ncbi:hypothetical protein LI328DRAFT_161719 [Trichoderma asperelloides]|nr:hypothetical protein LI328DRAFT_161719 [Trichoderma asperelloides]
MTRKCAENNQISGYKFLQCGTSVVEAKTSGCEYNILTSRWIPKPCFDSEAIKEYKTNKS